MLSVVCADCHLKALNVIMLSVVMLSVVAPSNIIIVEKYVFNTKMYFLTP
jgi:hypothetical protein